eukprot:1201928-Lingulodinium_polyedra.AAC.1
MNTHENPMYNQSHRQSTIEPAAMVIQMRITTILIMIRMTKHREMYDHLLWPRARVATTILVIALANHCE